VAADDNLPQTRQELTDTLEYFRTTEGGVYAHDGVAYGYLLDGHPSPYVFCFGHGVD
jgi:hypothetical protein